MITLPARISCANFINLRQGAPAFYGRGGIAVLHGYDFGEKGSALIYKPELSALDES